MGDKEQEAAALRESFMQRLEDIARGTVDASADFARRSDQITNRLEANTKALRGIATLLEELNSHIKAFEEFMAGMTATYQEGEEPTMREDLLDLFDNIGRVAEAFSQFSLQGRKKRS